MFQDEAGFGRINKPKYCWCEKGTRPSAPCHHIREYRYAYGAVEPLTGASCFLVMPYCDTVCMNLFLRELSNQFQEDTILLCCDGAAWHKAKSLELPDNIVLFHIPPYTPEMNPILYLPLISSMRDYTSVPSPPSSEITRHCLWNCSNV